VPQRLTEILGSAIPPIKVVDVGAMMLEEPPYAPILELPGASLVAFEPGEKERRQLVLSAKPGHTILPHVVGRGGPATFRSNTWNATSSLYEPHTRLLERFSGMAPLHTVAERLAVDTVSLDSLPEVHGMKYLKIDVQGAELDVILGAPAAMSTTVVAHVEVQFVPLYEGVPLHGDVDVAMRNLGFLMHSMTPPGCGTFAPLVRKQGVRGGQWMWADVLYVRDFMRFDQLSPADLLATALIAESCYGARDLALLALQHHDEKTGSGFYGAYCTMLLGHERAPVPIS
jgi:FkbM family methyltransferase